MMRTMKINREWLKTNWGAMTAAVCIGVVLFLALSHIPEIVHLVAQFFRFFRSIFLGIAIAYVLNPLSFFLERSAFQKMKKTKPRRLVSVMVAIAIVVFLIVLLSVFLVPQLAASTSTLVRNLNTYMQSLDTMTDRLSTFMSNHGIDISRMVASFQEKVNDIEASLPSNLDGVLKILRNVGTNILDIIIAFVLAIYFMADKERLMRGARQILRVMQKPATYEKTLDFLRRGNDILIRYILFDLLDGLIIGIANFIFMSIVGMPYAGLISFIVGITNLAPTFGPIVGGTIGAFLLVLINPWYALYFLNFTVAIQILDGYILKPRIFGGALGVPGVIVLICIVVGGKVFGAWGVILAIPFAAMAYYTLREGVLNRLAARGLPIEEESEDGKQEE